MQLSINISDDLAHPCAKSYPVLGRLTLDFMLMRLASELQPPCKYVASNVPESESSANKVEVSGSCIAHTKPFAQLETVSQSHPINVLNSQVAKRGDLDIVRRSIELSRKERFGDLKGSSSKEQIRPQ